MLLRAATANLALPRPAQAQQQQQRLLLARLSSSTVSAQRVKGVCVYVYGVILGVVVVSPSQILSWSALSLTYTSSSLYSLGTERRQQGKQRKQWLLFVVLFILLMVEAESRPPDCRGLVYCGSRRVASCHRGTEAWKG